MISDIRYQLADKIIKIDHHVNKENYGDINYVDTSEISCASIVVKLIQECQYELTPKGARALYVGLVTDSGRFRYAGVNASTFEVAAYLARFDFSIEEVYQTIYKQPLDEVILRAKYTQAFKVTPDKVAYLIVMKSEREENSISFSTASRGFASIMSDIEGISIWATFVENDEQEIIAELRSNRYNINQIAVKYGGGGHLFASGATLKNKEQVEEMIADLNRIVKEGQHES